MATTPTIVVGRNNWGIKNGNLLGYYQSDDGFFVKREFAATRGGGTNGTFVGSNGLIQTAASGNLPRIDFTGGSSALLVEPAATNLVPNGLSYNAVMGVLYDTTVTDSPATGINSARATKNEGAGNNRYASQIFSAIALSANTTYTVSRFFKFDGHTFATTLEASSSAQWGNVTWNQVINLASTGVTLGTSTNCTGSVENYGNGWFRVSVRVTTGATISGSTTVNVLSILPLALSTGQGFLASLPQFETGSIATSYIPTTTGSVTRNTDAISLTGATDYIGQTEGTVYLETNALVSGASDLFCFARATANTISISKNSSNIIQATVYTSGPSSALNIATSGTVSGNLKIAVAYKTGDSALYINGVQIGTSSNAFSFTAALTQININPTGSFEGNGNQRISALSIYNKRLSNQELIEITS